MRAALLLAILTTGCGDAAVQLELLVPTGGSDFDMSCVTAVDLLPLASGDAMTLDLGDRTDTVPCATITSPIKSFANLQGALSGKFDLDLPKAGLSSIVMRGRTGDCSGPTSAESVFYGAALYKKGDDSLRIKVARGISCSADTTFNVHPVNMLTLFGTGGACADYTDTSAVLQSAEIRATLLDTSPIVEEVGQASAPMSTPTVSIASFGASYPGSCAALELGATNETGISCINANQPTACAGSNLELAVLPDTFLASADEAQVKSFGAPNFIGVWTTTGVPGPVSGATITLDDGSPKNRIIYGDISSSMTFQPSGAAQTTSGGLAIVYVNAVVGITVNAPGKGARHIYIGADANNRSSQIVVLQ